TGGTPSQTQGSAGQAPPQQSTPAEQAPSTSSGPTSGGGSTGGEGTPSGGSGGGGGGSSSGQPGLVGGLPEEPGAEQARRKGARTDGVRAPFRRAVPCRGAGSWRAVRTVAGSSGGAGGWSAAVGRQFLRRLREVLRGVDGPPVGALR